MPMNTGLTPQQVQPIVEGLGHLLGDTYVLLVMTQKHHWNVAGPMFQPLHALFGAQYDELADAADVIAERIRALDAPAPGSFKQLGDLASIQQPDDEPGAAEMVQRLLDGHETCARLARALFETANAAHDQGTCDLAAGRLRAHEKAAWMLRATLA